MPLFLKFSSSMHFASTNYLPNFSISGNFDQIYSSRHKASEQKATTAADNELTKVNNKNTVT